MSKAGSLSIGDFLTKSGEPVVVQPDREYQQITVRMRHQGVVLRDRVLGESISTSRRYRARHGQLIISRIDARNGAVGLVPDELDDSIVSNDFWLFDINAERVNPAFLDWYVSTSEFVEQCVRASEGTTNRVRLQLDEFLSLRVSFPTVSEQRRLGDELSKLRRRVSAARSVLVRNDSRLIDLTVSLHLAACNPTIPVPVAELVQLHEVRQPVVPGRQYPQVGVKSFGRGLFSRETVDASTTTYRAFNELYSGALVLSQVKGWEGAVAMCPEDLAGRYVSPEYRTFRCDPTRTSPRYLKHIVPLRWFWERLTDATRGVGARRERTRPEQFSQLELPFPELSQQLKLLPLFDRIAQARSITQDAQLRVDSIVPVTVETVLGSLAS